MMVKLCQEHTKQTHDLQKSWDAMNSKKLERLNQLF